MNILGILGSLLGSSLTGGSQLGSVIGSALGTKLGGGSTKDAIKNALLQGVTGGGGGDFSSMMQQAALQSMLGGGGGGGRDTSGIMALMALQGMGGGSQGNPLAALFGGGMGGGSTTGGQTGGGMNPQMLFSGLGSLALMEALSGGGGEKQFKEQYASRYTGLRYDTPEERDQAEQMYEDKMGYPRYTGPRGYAQGGYIEGPGTGRSDSVPAMIHQNGTPVQEARLSDGEFVMTERAVRGAGNGDRGAGAARMYRMMREFERGAA